MKIITIPSSITSITSHYNTSTILLPSTITFLFYPEFLNRRPGGGLPMLCFPAGPPSLIINNNGK